MMDDNERKLAALEKMLKENFLYEDGEEAGKPCEFHDLTFNVEERRVDWVTEDIYNLKELESFRVKLQAGDVTLSAVDNDCLWVTCNGVGIFPWER